jgi:predicted DNA-binding transcriptional regulator AlpA
MTEETRRMLTVDQVLDLVPVSRSTLWRMQRDGTFPLSRMISEKNRAWYEDEVVAWQRSLPANDRIGRRIRRRG